MEYLTANISLYPKTTKTQEVLSLNTFSNPEAIISKNNEIIYTWNTETNRYNFKYDATIKTKNTIVPVNGVVKFPIQDLPEELKPYVEQTGYIDTTDEIVKKANELASGEQDLYNVVYKTADWVRVNIKYNLSTLTENVVQKASWVLEHKEGVCDEITVLFISLLRSVGIPAKFVSGVAYTNVLNGWGNHGWAEVYFPDYGWIPFDVTFAQYGWVDPGHIKLKESIDPSESSIRYSWGARDIELTTKEIEVNTTLQEKGEKIAPLAKLMIRPLVSEAGPGSYIPIKLVVENLQPFYLPNTLQITKAPNLTESNIKTLLLKPKQGNNLFWIIKLPENLEKNFIYSTVVEIKDLFGSITQTEIKYAVDYEIITLEDAKDMIKGYTFEKEEKTYSKSIALDCNTAKNYYYRDNIIGINCDVKNIGNVILNNLNVCLDKDCKLINLNIAETEKIKFNVTNLNYAVINARNKDVDVNDYLTFNIIDSPNLQISNLKFPEIISYEDASEISFTLTIDAPVRNVVGGLNGKNVINIKSLSEPHEIILSLKGSDLLQENKLVISYEDENGKSYKTEKIFSSIITDIPWYKKIINYLKQLFI